MEEVQIENQDGDRDPLLILGKIEDMMLYAYPVLNAYPKYERFVLAADIKRCMDQAMERTIEANKKYYKKTTLQELDVEIDKLRKYVRLSYRLKYIDFKKYKQSNAGVGYSNGNWTNRGNVNSNVGWRSALPPYARYRSAHGRPGSAGG